MAELIMMSQSRLLMGFVCFHQSNLFALEVSVESSLADRCWLPVEDKTPCALLAQPSARLIRVAAAEVVGSAVVAGAVPVDEAAAVVVFVGERPAGEVVSLNTVESAVIAADCWTVGFELFVRSLLLLVGS